MMGPGPGTGKHELLRISTSTSVYHSRIPMIKHETLYNFVSHHAKGSVTTILAAMFCSSSRQAALAGAGGHWARTLDIGVYIAGIAWDNWATTLHPS